MESHDMRDCKIILRIMAFKMHIKIMLTNYIIRI